jgi:hypothetical protein
VLDCNECEDRHRRLGSYCEACPHAPTSQPAATSPSRREKDVPVVLL